MDHNNGHNGKSSQTEILLAEDIKKTYGQRQALQGLSFSLKAGRILGFLGPNGAGKTTTIRILTTMMDPDSGRFAVNGIESKEPEKIRRIIGVLPENLGLPRQMTAIEYLTYFGQLYGRSATEARTYAQSLLEEVGLVHRARSLVGTYSHGMKQRLGIARALVNAPVVVFLDEPTLGLDPRGQQELLSLIQRIARERGVGVVLCSHALFEIEAVCDDVVILSAGSVIASGTVSEIIGQTQRNSYRIRVLSPSLAVAQRVLESVPDVKAVSPVDVTQGWLRLELADPANLAKDANVNNRILESLIRAEIPIIGFETEGGRLQDVFLQLTEEAVK
jgi:ABC-2 type transport system ATP-binding protein